MAPDYGRVNIWAWDDVNLFSAPTQKSLTPSPGRPGQDAATDLRGRWRARAQGNHQGTKAPRDPSRGTQQRTPDERLSNVIQRKSRPRPPGCSPLRFPPGDIQGPDHAVLRPSNVIQRKSRPRPPGCSPLGLPHGGAAGSDDEAGSQVVDDATNPRRCSAPSGAAELRVPPTLRAFMPWW